MARGQQLSCKCPACKQCRGIAYYGQWRKRAYSHGKRTGLPDSYGQWLVTCRGCGHVWYSRHPDARHAAGFPEYYHETTQEQRRQRVKE
jgi:hypothetical protein